MKKVILAAALLALSSNVYAGDLLSTLDSANAKVVEAQAKVDAKKVEIQAKQDEIAAKAEAKKAEADAKAAEKKAAQEAKQAETAEKINTLKTNLNNLTNSLSAGK